MSAVRHKEDEVTSYVRASNDSGSLTFPLRGLNTRGFRPLIPRPDPRALIFFSYSTTACQTHHNYFEKVKRLQTQSALVRRFGGQSDQLWVGK